MRRAVSLLFTALFAALGLTCARQTKQAGGLEVELSTDMPTPARFDAVHVVIQQETADGGFGPTALLDEFYVIPSAQMTLPTTISIAAGSGPYQEVLITVTALEGGPSGVDVVQRVVETQVPSDRVLALPIVLAAICAGKFDCPMGDSCQPLPAGNVAAGGCGTNVVAVAGLPAYSPNDLVEAGIATTVSDSGAADAAEAETGADADAAEAATADAETGADATAGDASTEAMATDTGAPQDGQGPPDEVCTGGPCAGGCVVNGAFYASGAGQPGNTICASCEPATSTSSWAPSLDGTGCGSAEVCSTGVCKSGCFIGGVFSSPGAGQPGNTICETCEPATSTSAWTAASEGTVCAMNEMCHDGLCLSGCFINETFYAAGAADPGNACQTCQPAVSTTTWTNADGITCSGGTCCSGACVDEQTSSAHCGGCGLACSTGCSGGECVVAVCTELPVPMDGLEAFGVDANNAYFTQTDAGGAEIGFESLTTCTQGGDTQNGIYEAVLSLSAGATGVFFSVVTAPYPTYEIRKYNPTAGTSIEIGLTGSATNVITSDATNVYWLNGSTLSKAPVSGAGPVTTLASIGAAGGITVDATYVYWADSTSVLRVPIAGGSATTLVSGVGSPGFLSVDASDLYWTGVSAALYRLPLGSTTSTELLGSQGTYEYPAIGPSTFYWSTGSQINAISLKGGAVGTGTASPVRVLYTAPGSDVLFGLGVVGNSLYWVDETKGALMKITPN